MADRNWNISSNSVSGEVREPEFDPSDFGFELYIPKRFSGNRSNNDKDYIIATQTKGGRMQMILSMCEDTSNFVLELIGDTANVYINAKGQILIGEGKSLVVSTGHNKNCKSGRCTISMSGLSDQLIEKHGNFRRLFMTAKPFAHGNAVLFAPTGEKE